MSAPVSSAASAPKIPDQAMAIQHNSRNRAANLPEDLIRNVAEYLDPRTTVNLGLVSRNWYDATREDRMWARVHIRQEKRLTNVHAEMHAEMSERVYPRDLVELFRVCRQPIFRLPVLELNQQSDYIDFVENREMIEPVMRFTSVGRPGIAILIHSSRMEYIDHSGEPKTLDPITRVYTIFQRYTNNKQKWVTAWGGSDGRIEGRYEGRHNRTDHQGGLWTNCPLCPRDHSGRLKPHLIRALLNGTDPDFSLGQPRVVEPEEEKKEE